MKELNRDNAITLLANSLSSRQPQLQMIRLDKGARERLNKQATLAIIMGARPFNLFEERYMKAFIHSVSGNTYTLPERHSIAGKELDLLYTELTNELTAKLAL